MPITGSTQGKSYARLNVMRLGATRLDYYPPVFFLTINGTNRKDNCRVNGVSIRDYLDGQPNTATLRVSGFTPTKGHEIKMALGSLDAAHFIFCGHILQTRQVYEGTTANIAWDLDCISYEWLLNRRKVTKRYTSTSASTIVTDLMSNYTSGFTVVNVAAGLASLDEITFTNEDVTDALDRIAKRVGAYWYIDYSKDLHFFLTDTNQAGPIADGALRTARGLSVATDLSQVKTRWYGEGGGSNASTDVAVGQTTIPVDDSTWYNPSGGTVVCGPQRIAYTGKSSIDGTGSKVGGKTGLAPGALSASEVSETAGNLSDAGLYRYKVTHVINGGETEAGTASSTAAISTVSNPASGPSKTATTGGSMTAGGTYQYAVAYGTAAGETTFYTDNTTVTLGGGDSAVSLTSIPTSSDDRVTKRFIYRFRYGFHDWRRVGTINDNSTTTFTDTTADASLGSTTPTYVNTASSGQMSLSNIATGPTGTTARNVYRTIAGGSEYKFAFSVSGNVTTTATDNVADGSLGEVAPTTSTIGPSVGDASLPVQELSAFASGGGWVTVAGQLIRYTGRSGSSGAGTLTGVPASGIGALTASVPYDTVVLNAPHLTGVSGVLYAFNKGEPVNLFVTVNNATAQTTMAGLVGGDGIHEGYVADRRMSETEITAVANANLTLTKDPLVTVQYQTRDQATRTGRTVSLNLTAPSVTGDFKLQSVTIDGFDAGASGAYADRSKMHFPMRTVQASSRRFSLEALLRLLKAA